MGHGLFDVSRTAVSREILPQGCLPDGLPPVARGLMTPVRPAKVLTARKRVVKAFQHSLQHTRRLYIYIYVHTYMHTYVRTYIHTYMYMYVHICTRYLVYSFV